MRLDEKLRRDLIAAWEDADTVEDAIAAIQGAIDAATPATQPIEDRKFGSYEFNPYNNPEKCGLTLLAAADEDEAYQFSIIALWRDDLSGRLFMAHDSGCSCPTPFEDVLSVSDLTEVKTMKDVTDFIGAASYWNPTVDSLASLLRAAREAVRR